MIAPVLIVDYDPAWPGRFDRERELVERLLGREALGIEHVGSTAVAGLAAKPTVDIIVGLRDEQTADRVLPVLAGGGFTDATPCPERPDWYYCVGKGRRPHDVHMHLAKHGGPFWERHLLFRDSLRAEPDTAAAYASLKRLLARRFGSDRQGYCAAKTGFIRWVEVRARGVSIRRMTGDDVGRLYRVFRCWGKERIRYQRYLLQQQRGERVVLVAMAGDEPAGYGSVVWRSGYEPFRAAGVPEVVDLNVIDEFQRRGIATAIIHLAEREVAATGRAAVGISVVQSPEYRAANTLYPRLGYVPDGRGITEHDNELHLVKRLA